METQTTDAAQQETKDVYALVTGKIIEQLEKGTVPWRKPWREAGMPQNLISKKGYRGINLLLLASNQYEHAFFLSFKQVKDIGAKVKRDEKGHMVVFWSYGDKPAETEQDTEETSAKRMPPVLRYYTVFNISQCENIPEKYLPKQGPEYSGIPMAEGIIEDMPKRPDIKHTKHAAFYHPIDDIVNIPKIASFESPESYYSTLFHEIVHSTGHRTRLDRKDLLQMSEFGSEAYSHEELVAEIGSCYLASACGILDQFDQSAAYIQGWLKKLKNDKRFVLSAASQAQKAVDFILHVQSEEEKLAGE